MTDLPRIVHIVSHTHWDREWYLSFNTFRIKLAKVVKRVLDALEADPSFEHFLLDGQSVILEDHFDLHPEDESRFRACIADGSLSVGPWYVLPDEFLISGESYIRNLLIGLQVARHFGATAFEGYMPDTFGHIAQAPQILRQAGLDSFIYWRGNGDEIDTLGLEYNWQAPDGSTVLAVQQHDGYCNAAGLGFAEIWHAHTRREVSLDSAESKVRDLLTAIASRSSTDIALINNGCDHFPPQQRFGDIISHLRHAMPGVEFRHSSLRSFLSDLRQSSPALHTFQGEMTSGKLAHILSGVWSARMYLKQANDQCQTRLSGHLEPLASYTHFVHQRDYPIGPLRHAWKTLLKNHPHDSICGCSIDEVHADMMPRFRAVEEVAEECIIAELEHLTPEFARKADDDRHTIINVANTLPQARSCIIERLIILQPCCDDIDDLRLIDHRGRQVPMRIIDSQFVERFWGVDYRLMLDVDAQLERFAIYKRDFGSRILRDAIETDLTDRFMLIQFLAEDLPAVGHATYALTTDAPDSTMDAPQPVRIDGHSLENEFLRVDVHPNGTIDMLHFESGRLFKGLNLLESTEDIGDEYDYAPARGSGSHTTDTRAIRGTISVYRDTGLTGVLEVAFTLDLPQCLTADRRRRSDDLVACPVRIRFALYANSQVVDIDVRFVNQARDHRLRAHFPSGITTDTIHSDGHFFTNPRPINPPTGEDWVQPAPGTYPQQDYSIVQDASGGIALFNRGLPEIQANCDDSGATGLALTLLRCVGWLSRDDFETRRCQNAGPTVATPDAQCIGPQRFRYAIMPFSGDWVSAGVHAASRAWHVNPLVIQGVADLNTPAGHSLVELNDPRIAVTAVKRHEERETLIVRLYNLTGEPVHAALTLGLSATGAWHADILERRTTSIALDSSTHVPFEAPPYRIMTIEIAFNTPR